MKPKTIVLLVILALILIVFIQNTEVVAFPILFWKISMPRIIFLLVMTAVGFIIGYTVGRSGKKTSTSTVTD